MCVCVAVFTLNHAILRFNNNRLGNEVDLSVDLIHLKPTWNVPGNFFVQRPTTIIVLLSFHNNDVSLIPWNLTFVVCVFRRKMLFVFSKMWEMTWYVYYHILLKGENNERNDVSDKINKNVIETWIIHLKNKCYAF